MEQSPPDDPILKLKELGQALDIEQPVSVSGGGRVFLSDARERKESDHDQRQEKRRPPTYPRKRTGRERRASGGARTPSAAAHFRSERAEVLYGVGALELAREYSAKIFEEELGIWVAAKSKPLGVRGPLFHILVAVPFEQRIMPRAWAFHAIGPNCHPVGPRHTNFGDASICAFMKENRAWDYPDGLVRLVDLYSVWLLKQHHLAKFGWWPGPQVGPAALYRRLDFQSREWCGCLSGLKYENCHQQADSRVPDELAQFEFRRTFMFPYESRVVPPSIFLAAKSKWSQIPSMNQAYSFRPLDPVRI